MTGNPEVVKLVIENAAVSAKELLTTRNFGPIPAQRFASSPENKP
jgi:hypothetical protein